MRFFFRRRMDLDLAPLHIASGHLGWERACRNNLTGGTIFSPFFFSSLSVFAVGAQTFSAIGVMSGLFQAQRL